ncbi:hypothetical protein L1887_22616 [Cichorium endivia]|nr:hypothetical protein L1887_22616 [Cichorium endivia]
MEVPVRKHIVMVPFMAQGHLIPFLELAHKIIHHNPTFTITIVARSFGTVNYTFATSGAYGTAAFFSISINQPHRNIADGGILNEFPVPGFPESCRFSTTQLHPYFVAADGKDEWSTFLLPQLSHSLNSNGWLCNTIEEMETMGCEALRNFIKLPLWCIGPLLPSHMLKKTSGLDTGSSIISQRSGKLPAIEPKKCIEWLDSHPQGSVLYISFGSQNTISETQMMELANGLEESKKPFIWVIRPPIGFEHLNGGFRPEWLPSGFEDRVKSQGLVEEVKKVIEVVLDKNEDGKGNDMRKKATEFRKLIQASVDGSSNKAMDDFISAILSD